MSTWRLKRRERFFETVSLLAREMLHMVIRLTNWSRQSSLLQGQNRETVERDQ